jgi:hypothetical protein
VSAGGGTRGAAIGMSTTSWCRGRRRDRVGTVGVESILGHARPRDAEAADAGAVMIAWVTLVEGGITAVKDRLWFGVRHVPANYGREAYSVRARRKSPRVASASFHSAKNALYASRAFVVCPS